VAASHPVTLTNNLSATGQVGALLPTADVEVVEIRVVGGGAIIPGQTTWFEIDVRNNGPAEALGAVLIYGLQDADWFMADSSRTSEEWSWERSGSFLRRTPMPVGVI
jgi:hypothetical protein